MLRACERAFGAAMQARLEPFIAYLCAHPSEAKKTWLRIMMPSVRTYLCDVGKGVTQFCDADLERIAPARACRMLRGMLLEAGLLVPPDVEIFRTQRWLAERIAPRLHPQDARLIEQYFRFSVIPCARFRRETGQRVSRNLTHARYTIKCAVSLLQGVRAEGHTLETYPMHELDRHLARLNPDGRHALAGFVRWCHRSGLTHLKPKTLPLPIRSEPAPLDSSLVHRMVAITRDPSYPERLRLALGLLVCFAVTPGVIVTIARDHVSTDGRELIVLDRKLAMIEPYDELLRNARAEAGPWLFPSPRFPCEHLSASTLLNWLRRRSMLLGPVRAVIAASVERLLLVGIPAAIVPDGLAVSREFVWRVAQVTARPAIQRYLAWRRRSLEQFGDRHA